MSIQDRAHNIRARLTADMRNTLLPTGLLDDDEWDTELEALLDDAMHQVEILLGEIQGHEERAALRDNLPPTGTPTKEQP